jgi:hypothetical protein
LRLKSDRKVKQMASASLVPNRKVVAQFVASALFAAVAYVVQKAGFHETVGDAALVSGVIASVAGAVAGYVVKEADVVVADVAKVEKDA